MTKKPFVPPQMETVRFSPADVILTSGDEVVKTEKDYPLPEMTLR